MEPSGHHPALKPALCLFQVLVTGAGGKTGKIILSKLLALPDQYKARGLFHSDAVCQPQLKHIPSLYAKAGRRLQQNFCSCLCWACDLRPCSLLLTS